MVVVTASSMIRKGRVRAYIILRMLEQYRESIGLLLLDIQTCALWLCSLSGSKGPFG